jgi:hypothetical protein
VALIPNYQELLLTIQEVGIKIEESRKEERIPANTERLQCYYLPILNTRLAIYTKILF